MRGQAFIAFQDSVDSASAMRALQQFNFYDRPLHISYAKSKSNIFKLPKHDIFPNKRPTTDIEDFEQSNFKRGKLEQGDTGDE